MEQLPFPPLGRGGYRPGSGRKRGRSVTHHGRDGFPFPVPLHCVWRTRDDVHNLRGKRLWRQIRKSFQRCCEKEGFRLVHFSVQGNHVHLIVEADELNLLSRGMQGLGVSMAKRINFTLDRTGPAFVDRYFSRRLSTPREVANALDYVLHNHERHLERMGLDASATPDPFCSAALLDEIPPLRMPPETWLLRVGYLRAKKAA